MLRALSAHIKARPLTSSLIGLMIGTTGVSLATLHPQMERTQMWLAASDAVQEPKPPEVPSNFVPPDSGQMNQGVSPDSQGSSSSSWNGTVPPGVPLPSNFIAPSDGSSSSSSSAPSDPGKMMDQNQEQPPTADTANGPSADQQQMDVQQQQMQKDQLARMQKSFAQAAKQLKRISTSFDGYRKAGLTISSDCADALGQAQTIVDAVQAAQTMDDVQNAGADGLPDLFQQLQDCHQALQQLSQLPRILKKVDAQIKRTETRWAKAKLTAPSSASSAVTEGDSALQTLNDARAQITQDMQNGTSPEDIQSTLQDSVVTQLQLLQTDMQEIQAARDANRFLTQVAHQIHAAQLFVAQQQKAGKDTSELEDILSRTQDAYTQVKTLEANSDAFMGDVEDLAILSQALSQSMGGSGAIPSGLIQSPVAPVDANASSMFAPPSMDGFTSSTGGGSASGGGF